MTAEQIYDQLPRVRMVQAFGDHSKWDSKGSKGGSGKKAGKGDKRGKDGDGKEGGKGDKKDGGGGNGKSDKSEDESEKGRKEAMTRKWLARMRDAAKDKGDVPGSMRRFFQYITPQEDWRQILAEYLSTTYNDYSLTRPNRRYLDRDYILPSKVKQNALDPENIVIAIDTSGSVNGQLLNKFVSEVKSLVDQFPNIKGHVVDCDAETGTWQELETFNPKKLSGGGGTDFRPVIRDIKKLKNKPKVLVYFTDGWGAYPEVEPSYPILWLLTEDYNVPFGRKVILHRL